MTEDRDLLPWILGGLSMAAVAMAIAVSLTGRSTPAHASSQAMPTLATADLNPNIPSGSAATAATPAGIAQTSGTPASMTPASLLPTPSQSVAAATPSGTQIWECTTNGVKTFSNDRCGSTAILRDVGPINVMDASPVASNVHWYGPDSNDASDYYQPASPPPADNSYPVVVGIPYLERRRPEHPHHPNNHDRR